MHGNGNGNWQGDRCDRPTGWRSGSSDPFAAAGDSASLFMHKVAKAESGRGLLHLLGRAGLV